MSFFNIVNREKIFAVCVSLLAWLLAAQGARLLATAGLAAGEPTSFKSTAEKLQRTTFTIRWVDAAKPSASPAPPAPEAPQATVVSGVSLGEGHVVTVLDRIVDQIRITLADGEQTTAQLRVLDEYSGLALLETPRRDLPYLELSTAAPQAGDWTMSAAAWGAERPVVSLGVISGVGRALPGANYPPLIQCDLRTTETSTGAPLVDREGKLWGVLVAAQNGRRGWAYAVGVRHVRRLLTADISRRRQKRPLEILPRRRPVVGMVLDGGPDTITVRQVVEGGPAQRAGLREGDQIVAVEGMRVRSVYQAIRPIFARQPGDEVRFLVRQNQKTRTIDLVLGAKDSRPSSLARLQGNVAANPSERVRRSMQPRVVVRQNSKADAQDREFEVRQLSTPPVSFPLETLDVVAGGPEGQHELARSTPSEKLKLLEKALNRYRNVIEHQQQQLQQREKDQHRANRRIESLRKEVEHLKQQLQTKKQPAQPKKSR